MDHPTPGRARHPLDNAYVYLVAATLMWAGNAVAGRLIVGEVSPMVIVAARWIMVTAILATFAGPKLAVDWKALKPHLGLIALLGIGGYTGFNALFYAAAHTTTAVNMSILQGAIPIFVFLISFLVFRQKLSIGQVGGLVLGLAGIVAVATDLDLDRLIAFRLKPGDLFLIIASGLYAVYTIMLRRCPKVQALSLFTVMAAAAMLASLPLLGLEAWWGALQWPTPKGWAILFYIALFPSFLSQLAYMRAVNLIGPARAGLFANLVPVLGSIGGVMIGESLVMAQIIGLVLVVGGILWAERR